ncbi:hypothetical protein A1332_03390 [Methylomonas methanica]|uniref:Methyltransferase type 11 n=2 Tax=Methylomonas methanica TaxID=421 RepID=A0A177M6U7_METMH|nr:hypothetical protein A1332_03390 [Methylomonas methanica]
MMFGTRETFEYFQCNTCGCLQISEIPKDLAKYYPSDYAPHTQPETYKVHTNWFIGAMQKQRCRTALFDKHHKLNSFLKRFVDLPKAIHEKPSSISSVGEIIRTAGISSFGQPILDVGCGIYPYWLSCLEKLGFTELSGVDPLISCDQAYDRIKVFKSELRDIPGKFSLITLHHSLEHIFDQNEMFTEIEKHLLPDGVCLVRIPIFPSKVWEEYGTNWVELDAPRHFYLHSLKSIKMLANKAGLEIFDTQYDTTAFEFYGSEMYTRDIPLTEKCSPFFNENSSLFTEEQMNKFKARANEVNESKQAGRAAFFIRKKN